MLEVLAKITLFAILALAGIQGAFATIPASESMPFDRSMKPFLFQFYLTITEVSIGIVLNSLSLYLFCHLPNKEKVSLFTLIVALNTSDLVMCLYQLIRNVLDVEYLYFYGRYIACQFDAFIISFCFTFSLCIIVSIAYVTRIELTQGIKTNNRGMMKYVAFCFFINALIIGLCVTVMGSVQYTTQFACLINLSTLESNILFNFPLLIFPLVYMGYNLRIIYVFVKNSQRQLPVDNNGVPIQAKAKYVHMTVKMIYFFAGLIISLLGAEVGAIYSGVTNNQLPAFWSFPGGIVALSTSSIINPLLFFYLNYDLQVAFWEEYKKILMCLRGSSLCVFINFKNSSTGVIYETKIDYANWETWLEEPLLFPIFLKDAAKNYATESLLFFSDVEEFKTTLEQSNEINIELINETVKNIYLTYIQVPHAPLEINISNDERLRIERFFETQIDGKLVYDASKRIKDGKWIDESMFDESQNEVARIIETDIFPRFSRSKVFVNAVNKHMNQELEGNNVNTLNNRRFVVALTHKSFNSSVVV